jgi:hypothetical protein
MALRLRTGENLLQAHRKHFYQLLANECAVSPTGRSLSGTGAVQLVLGLDGDHFSSIRDWGIFRLIWGVFLDSFIDSVSFSGELRRQTQFWKIDDDSNKYYANPPAVSCILEPAFHVEKAADLPHGGRDDSCRVHGGGPVDHGCGGQIRALELLVGALARTAADPDPQRLAGRLQHHHPLSQSAHGESHPPFTARIPQCSSRVSSSSSACPCAAPWPCSSTSPSPLSAWSRCASSSGASTSSVECRAAPRSSSTVPGTQGKQIAAAFQLSDEFHPVAFVDDDVQLYRRSTRGIDIHPAAELGRIKPRT